MSARATKEGIKHHIAQLYDEVARKEWSVRAARGDLDFDVNRAALREDSEILARAKALYAKPEGPSTHPKKVRRLNCSYVVHVLCMFIAGRAAACCSGPA